MEKIKVLLLDGRELFRVGLGKILSGKPNIEVVALCSNGLEGIQRASELKPDVILFDLEITQCDCIEVIQRIRELLPEVRIIALTHSEDEYLLFSAFEAGVRGYISKDVTVEEIVSDIIRAYTGDVMISPPMAEKLLKEFTLFAKQKQALKYDCNVGLSKREIEVLALVAEGATNKEIGIALSITENTVKAHLSKILEKLHARNRQQAVALAVERGIISISN